MDFVNAFWEVVNKISSQWRPIRMGCCDCKAVFYLTKSKVIEKWKDDLGNFNPVYSCPVCGSLHCVVFIKIDDDTKSIKVEIVK